MKRVALFLLIIGLPSVQARGAPPPPTSCTLCHASAEWFDEQQRSLPAHAAESAHAAAGISCHDCHGGNPDPALADDYGASMDPEFGPNPYRGSPSRAELPAHCGSCHSDLAYMRRYDPSARVDQLTEYWTSGHGQALQRGDENVAVCSDCHGVHDIRRAGDPRSRVYPLQVAATCGVCHSDSERMSGYTTAHGHPMPVHQQARWRRSVHAEAMLEKADLSAPTCNDCHGNHGALPPGLESIGRVCGQCHGREAELFRNSPKKAGLDAHEAFLSGEGCTGCHEEIKAASVQVSHFGECTTCHDHHGVVRPTVALLGPLPATPCAFCHELGLAEGAAEIVPERAATRENFLRVRDALSAEAEGKGIEGDQRFDWLVDQALVLPAHVVSGPGASGETPRLRPEFARLFEKFRIGKTHYTYADPTTGREVATPVVRCTDCHHDAEGAGLAVAAGILAQMQQLTAATARAERYLLAAHRGGVEVRAARDALDGAVSSQIELEVLVHRFALDGAFVEKQEEGMAFAASALAAGNAAMEELAYRRRGLFIALAIAVAVLVGLAFKIRQIS